MTVASESRTLDRNEIPSEHKWRTEHIYPDWEAWEAGVAELENAIADLAGRKGSLSGGPGALREVLQARDGLEVLSHRVYWFAALRADEDLRDNQVQGYKQRVGTLLSKAATALSWFNPEVLALGRQTVEQWLDTDDRLGVYRFALLDLFRQHEHVLDEAQERLLSLSARLAASPQDAYSMLTTADVEFPEITLSGDRTVKLSHQRYHTILQTEPLQADRETAFRALYSIYERHANTYAALYNGVCQRDWFLAQARNHATTLESALDGNDIPAAVVENLIATTKRGTDPLRRYFQLRQRVLGLETIHPYDGTVPLVQTDRRYPYDEAVALTLESVERLGPDYRAQLDEGFRNGWVDVYESEGKRSGAYSAPVYGVHPYVLMNYNDTMGDMFTLAHEMGHSMHTVLAHGTQPVVYADYTIFVAEVASTLNEALLLELLLSRTEDPKERVLLLQHAIDSIVGTFYTQTLFADYELQAHRRVEAGEPITADALGDIYLGLLREYYADSVTLDDAYRVTWARIPHFFRSPYYVYQYATCFASAAAIKQAMDAGETDAVPRYLELLSSGGNDHPMNQLRKAGVDLSQPEAVEAVIARMGDLVDRLAVEIDRL